MNARVSFQQNLNLDESLTTDKHYTDEITRISVISEKIKLSTKELEKPCTKWSMKINAEERKIISTVNDNISMKDIIAEKIKELTFFKISGSKKLISCKKKDNSSFFSFQ